MGAIGYLLRSICPFLHFAIRASAAVISPQPHLSNPQNLTSTFNILTNAITLGSIDPSKLTITSQYFENRLPTTSVLMTTLDAMVRLAVEDWEGQERRQTFVMEDPRYNKIEIFISPPDMEHGLITRAYATLGIFLAMNSILTDPTQRFNTCHHDFFYNRLHVGFLEIRPQGWHPDPPTLTDSLAPAIHGNTAKTLSASAWVDPHLSVEITQGPESLVIYEVFYAVYALIRQTGIYAAAQPRNARIRDFTFGIVAPPITTRKRPIIFSVRSLGNPPRTMRNPPWFQAKWLIKVLGGLPQYMLDRPSFREVRDMIITVDKVKVGQAWLVRDHLMQAEAATS